MAANTYYFTGKCNWAKVYKPDTKFTPGKYSLDFIFANKEDIKEFKAIKLRNVIKVDDDGNQYVNLGRKLGKKPWPKEVPIEEREDWGPPEVVDKDGNKFDKLIGNGSTVAVEIVAYDGQLGKGSRLEKVVVIEHVPYEREGGDNEDEAPKTGAAVKPAGLPF